MTDEAASFLLHASRVVVRSVPDSAPFTPGPWADLVIERRADAREIGSVGVRLESDEPTAEIRITLLEGARGQGFATEVLDAVVAHLLEERELARVVAFVPAADERTQHLLERVGLRVVAADGADLLYLRRAVRRTK